VEERFNRLIATRNKVEHDKAEFLSRPIEEVREAMRLAAQAGETAIADLLSRRVLPQVLQPLEEHRDRWERLRLELQDAHRRTVEMFVDFPTDLAKPLLWFPAGSNPREVAPSLVKLSDVADCLRGLPATP
jgi:hypothetical protein